MTATSIPSFELISGALRLAVCPDLGGSIAGLWHGDTPILRSTEPDAITVARKAACYPLVPYSNRLADRRFRWQGHDYTTQPNFDDSPHSLHGVAWMRSWEVVSRSDLDLVIHYVHPGDGNWPFPFEVSQHFELTPHALDVRLVIVNTANQPQPVGLGWHPYFQKRSRSHLQIDVSDRWDPDPAELPVRKVAQAGIDSDVSSLDYDNCFEGWRGAARIRDERFALRLTSSVGFLVVFTPQDRDYFCVEPVSHVSNAINMPDPAAHGLRTLAPGEAFEASFHLDIAVV